MEDLIIDQIKENSNVPLHEGTESADISFTDQMISKLIDAKYNQSLAYQLCEVQPLNGSFGKIFTTRRKNATSDFEVITKNVETRINTIKTGFTQEVLQDMNNQFGKSAKKASLNVLSGLSDQDENRSIITILFDESTTKPALTVTDSGSFESILFQVGQRVAESVIELNQEEYKTLDSFCVLPKSFAAAILGSFDFMDEGTAKSLFVGKVGRTDFYINPFPNTASQFTDDFDIAYEIESTSIPEYAYVGLKSKTAGQSSLIFCPYTYESEFVNDPETGALNLFIRNRYGLITSPLHKPLENKPLLHKFELIKG